MAVAEVGQRLAVSFVLQRRISDGPFLLVDIPDLSAWNAADAGVDRYVFRKRIDNLSSGGNYRVLVRYRWSARSGRVLATRTRPTAQCRVPRAQHPDLLLAAPEMAPIVGQGAMRYAVEVRNEGRGRAAAFDLVVTIAGRSKPPLRIAGLAPGKRALAALLAEPCAPGSTVTFTVDPANRLDEVDEANNSVSALCRSTVATLTLDEG